MSYVESEFAAYTGHKYCVALNSCGSAIYLALWAAGVKDGDKVLSNALTFNAVPSAIHHARAEGVAPPVTSTLRCVHDRSASLHNKTACQDGRGTYALARACTTRWLVGGAGP